MELNSNQQFNWITTSSEILEELIRSRDHGNVIGITALSLGPSMVITAVEEIVDIRNDKIILLKEIDLLGIRIPESDLLLTEIVRVHPLRTKYNDPFHVNLRDHWKK
jgi:hypothetical protein